MKNPKNEGGGGVGSGGGGGSGWGGQGGCEWRIEVFVKIKKNRGGGGLGGSSKVKFYSVLILNKES